MLAGCGRLGFAIEVAPAPTDAPTEALTDSPIDAADPPFALAGQRILLPCGVHMGLAPNGCTCLTSPVTQTVTLAGTAAQQFQVTIHLRGAFEVNPQYAGGTATSTPFYIGGTSVGTVYNVYTMTVSSPAETYFLNNGPAVPVNSDALDYEAVFAVDGDATVTFTGDCQDIYQYQNLDANNLPITFPGVVTNPDPYDGQFAQIDVLAVQLL